MRTLVIVTGGSAGIGRAMLHTAPPHTRRICVSRSDPDLAGVEHWPVDLADPDAWSSLGTALAGWVADEDWDRITVVHAAGTLEPIGYMGEVDTAALTTNVLLDAASPLVLGHLALAALRGIDARRELVLLSSGAARSSYPGWATYSAAKAAVDRWVATVGEEQGDRGGVTVLSVAPGVVATAMQERIRATDERDFPRVERFRDLHADGLLASPDDVAVRLWDLLDAPDIASGAVIDLRER